MNINLNILESTWVPSVCALLAVTLAMLVIIDSMIYISSRYKERYLKEAAVELDDVLLQMPADRIFDLSLADQCFFMFYDDSDFFRGQPEVQLG